jgi:CrcB protein
MKWIHLAVGTLAGGFSRYLLAGAVHNVLGETFPHGTFIVNATGCFLIGLLNALSEVKFMIGPHGRILLMTGFCGAFTTFSTWMLESSNLLKDGESLRAFLNIAASVGLGFLLFRLGEWIGSSL